MPGAWDELPLPEPHDHPDNHAMKWSDCELRWIAARDAMWAERVAAAVARERERAIDIVAMFGGSVEIEAAIRGGD